MNVKGILIRIGICITIFGICLYSYIDKQNKLTSLQMIVPHLVKDIDDLAESVKKLQYEIDQFENPMHLLELAKNPEFSHLKHPIIDNILKINEGMALQVNNNRTFSSATFLNEK
jgi:hypothetical protein